MSQPDQAPDQDEQPLLDVRIADLATAHLDGQTMVDRDEPWTYELPEREGHDVVVAINTDEPNDIDPPGCMVVEDAAPHRMLLWDNGWVVYQGPGGGGHVGGPDDEDRWIEQLSSEVRRLGGDLTVPEGDDDE